MKLLPGNADANILFLISPASIRYAKQSLYPDERLHFQTIFEQPARWAVKRLTDEVLRNCWGGKWRFAWQQFA